MRKISAVMTAFALAIAAFGMMPAYKAAAATDCGFTRDLTTGSSGEDVRCLQKYLNGAGYVIAASGVGAPGQETTLYGGLTSVAVKKWQAANGLSASGSFGPLSRAKYKLLIGGTSVPTTPSTPSVPSGSTAAAVTARQALLNALNRYDLASGDFEDAEDEDDDVGDAEDLLADARDSLIDAMTAFLNGNYTGATSLANDSKASSEDALDEIDGSSSNDGAQSTAINGHHVCLQKEIRGSHLKASRSARAVGHRLVRRGNPLNNQRQ